MLPDSDKVSVSESVRTRGLSKTMDKPACRSVNRSSTSSLTVAKSKASLSLPTASLLDIITIT